MKINRNLENLRSNIDSYIIKKNRDENDPNSVSNTSKSNTSDQKIRVLKQQGVIPCNTCDSRRYQDSSFDPGVSFKAPGYISPEASSYVVMSHEMQHVANEQSKAESQDKTIVSQNVQIYNSICPECGKAYIAGGKTTTVTKGNETLKIKEPNKGEKIDLII